MELRPLKHFELKLGILQTETRNLYKTEKDLKEALKIIKEKDKEIQQKRCLTQLGT